VARCRLENDASLLERTSLSVDDIIELLTLCLDATLLSFRRKVYKQVHGSAVGSPVSVVVANLVMEDVEERTLESFPNPHASGSAMLMTPSQLFPRGEGRTAGIPGCATVQGR